MQEIFLLVNPSFWAVPETKPLKFTKNVLIFAKHGLNPPFYKVCVCVCVCVFVCDSFLSGEVTQYDASYTQALI